MNEKAERLRELAAGCMMARYDILVAATEIERMEKNAITGDVISNVAELHRQLKEAREVARSLWDSWVTLDMAIGNVALDKMRDKHPWLEQEV